MKALATILILAWIFGSCQNDPVIDSTIYDCQLSFADTSKLHPKAHMFQDELDRFKGHTVGVQAAVCLPNGSNWTGVIGMADIPNGIDMETCTPIMIGSTSKIITAALILKLHDEGLLSINDLVSKHLPQSDISQIANAKNSSIKNLLDHSSGIPDYLAMKWHVNSVNKAYNKETQREKLKYVHGKKALFAVGSDYEYSNTNYVLLGLIIEEIRNKPLWEVIHDEVAIACGLMNFRMGSHADPIPEGTARPYIALDRDKYSDVMHYAVADAATGDGGIAANMQDLNAFMAALFNGKIISASSLESMLTDLHFDNGSYGFKEEYYGLGIEKYVTPFGIAYGHTGSTSAYECYSMYFPEDGTAASIAFNGISEKDDQEVERIEMLLNLVAIAKRK